MAIGRYQPAGTFATLNVKVVSDGKSLRFRLDFLEREHFRPIEFLMQPGIAMGLMRTLQAFHATHKWPIPDLKPAPVQKA
jgi:hypothetical protein